MNSPDTASRLNAALEGRYRIERELRQGSSPLPRTCAAVQPLGSRLAMSLALVLTLSACSDTPSTPEVVVQADVDALLAQAFSEDSADGGSSSYEGTLYRALRRAREVVLEKHGENAAQSISERLRSLAAEVEAAREAKDRERFRAARIALETEAAKIAVRVLGPTVVGRVLRAGGDRLRQLRARIDAAASDGADVTRAQKILARQRAIYEDALAARASGDLPAALRLGAGVLDSLARLD